MFKRLLAVMLASCAEDAAADKLLDSCDDADEAVLFLYRARRRSGAAKQADLARAQEIGDGIYVTRNRMGMEYSRKEQ